MESTDKAMIKCIGLIVNVDLSKITVTMSLSFMLIQQRMQALNPQGQCQDE